jgi:hypothetical protein
VLPAFQWCFEKLKALELEVEEEEEESYFKSAVKLSLEKLGIYIDKLLRDSEVYAAATVLHPSLNIAWFKDKWR